MRGPIASPLPRLYFYVPAGATRRALHRSLARPLFIQFHPSNRRARSPAGLELEALHPCAPAAGSGHREKLASASLSDPYRRQRGLSAAAMDDDASSSPAASYIRLVQHLIEKCICYKMNKEECMETLEKHAKIMPVITSTVWKELEKENREFFETYKKQDRGGGPNQQQAAAGHHHPARVQQSLCPQESSSMTLQKNPSGEQEQRVVVEKEKRKNPSDDEQVQRVMEKEKEKEKENRKNNPSASSKSSDKDI